MRYRPTPSPRARFGVLIALFGVLGLLLSACSAGSTAKAVKTVTVVPSATKSSPSSAPASSSSAAPTSSAPTGAPVHVKLLESDGSSYGVGMPIIAYFSAKITDATAFAKATTVKVNGADAGGAWFFQDSAQMAGYPLEAHYRPQNYWPGHAAIQLNMPVQGLSAGPGLVFDDSLTLSMATGAAQVSSVNMATETMTVTSDGAVVKTMPVSLGAAQTPTYNGVKVVMEKDNPERMIGTGNDVYNILVPWSVRVTNSGEFIHAASWNGGNIGVRSTSNGCTNLNTADAEWYYNFAQIGDPVTYSNTGGSEMPSWDGYGDWNVPWSVWQQGGEVPTTSS